MKISIEEYKEMIEYFEDEIKVIATRAAQRDATYSFVAYSCYNIRYFPKDGGRVDFYSSGDASIVFNSIYSGQNTFFVSDNDVCIPDNTEVRYDISTSTITPTFSTYHTFSAPTPPTPVPIQHYDYQVGPTADIMEIEISEPGEYKFGDCSCTGDQFLYLYDPTTTDITEYWKLQYSDDDCGPFNHCSYLKYYHNGPTKTPKTFNLYIGT